MTQIDPKPTQYRGTQYKSVLEARWAVFLDHHFLVEDWKYELRSFAVPQLAGNFYTPDFWFSIGGMDLWLEAKPVDPEPDYLAQLNNISYYWKLNLLLGVGSYYKSEPEVYQFPADDYVPGVNLSDWGFFSVDDGKAVSIAQRFRFDINGPRYVPPRKEADRALHQKQMSKWIKDAKERARRKRS